MGARTAVSPQQENGRVPPHDERAEESLLGAALLTRDALDVLVTRTKPADFYRPNHQHIAAALTKAYVPGEAPDPVIVAAHLERDGVLEQVGGLGALLSLQVNTPSSSNAAKYADLVTEHALGRRRISLANDLREAVFKGESPANALAELQALELASVTDDEELPYLEQIRRHLIFGDDIDNIPASEPLIEGILDVDTLAVLYGHSGHGKSFVALDWALSVSTGSWWQRHLVRPGKVLYVVAEGVRGMGPRKNAWKEHNRVYMTGDFTWLPYPPNLFKEGWAAALAQYASELQPSLIVVDTLARSMVGGDENSGRDIGIVVAGCDRIRRACGACVLLVHHTGKNEAAGMRGHSALEAAVDAAIECKLTDEGAVEIVTAKQKDRPSGEKVQLRMVPVGTTGSVALAEWRGSTEPDELPAHAVDLLAVLGEMDMGDGVASTPWLTTSKMQQRSYHRWRKRFIEMGLVFEVPKGKFQLSARGARVAAGEPLNVEPAADDEF